MSLKPPLEAVSLNIGIVLIDTALGYGVFFGSLVRHMGIAGDDLDEKAFLES